ncbi:MAG: CXXX repeat peptide modification system protein [Prevotella sp.]|nr:CXXX repeat peptide modification system protein [Prevotella sp.]
MKKIVGQVTENEKRDILKINNHKNSLEELLLILPEKSDLYLQALSDLNKTKKMYQEWWDTYYAKYQWEKGEREWSIIFDTNEIVIDI